MIKLGLGIQITQAGNNGPKLINEGAWSKHIVDLREVLSLLHNHGIDCDNILIMFSYIQEGMFITMIRKIKGRKQDNCTAFIYIPKQTDITAEELYEVVTMVKAELGQSSFNLPKLKELFSREYPEKKNYIDYHQSATSGLAYRIVPNKYSLKELLGEERYQISYTHYRYVLILEENDLANENKAGETNKKRVDEAPKNETGESSKSKSGESAENKASESTKSEADENVKSAKDKTSKSIKHEASESDEINKNKISITKKKISESSTQAKSSQVKTDQVADDVLTDLTSEDLETYCSLLPPSEEELLYLTQKRIDIQLSTGEPFNHPITGLKGDKIQLTMVRSGFIKKILNLNLQALGEKLDLKQIATLKWKKLILPQHFSMIDQVTHKEIKGCRITLNDVELGRSGIELTEEECRKVHLTIQHKEYDSISRKVNLLDTQLLKFELIPKEKEYVVRVDLATLEGKLHFSSRKEINPNRSLLKHYRMNRNGVLVYDKREEKRAKIKQLAIGIGIGVVLGLLLGFALATCISGKDSDSQKLKSIERLKDAGQNNDSENQSQNLVESSADDKTQIPPIISSKSDSAQVNKDSVSKANTPTLNSKANSSKKKK